MANVERVFPDCALVMKVGPGQTSGQKMRGSPSCYCYALFSPSRRKLTLQQRGQKNKNVESQKFRHRSKLFVQYIAINASK